MAARDGKVLMAIMVASLGASCVTVPRIAPPPEKFGFDRTYITTRDGFVLRAAYFTPEQEKDPGWEKRRFEVLGHVQMCKGMQHIRRRDVRWHPAATPGDGLCAAIVYDVECSGRPRAGVDSGDQDRLYLLRQDSDRPLPAGCGEKDWGKLPPQTVSDPKVKLARGLSPSARCEGGDLDPSRPLHVHDETRIHIETLIRPEFADGRRIAEISERMPLASIESAFSKARLIIPRIRESAIPDDGVNILVTQTFALNGQGEPYCVEITAKQGQSVWRRHIARERLVEELRTAVGLDENGRSKDPSRYWTPLSDARILGDLLGATLAASSDPVYTQGRARRLR